MVNVGLMRTVKAIEESYRGDVTVYPAPGLREFSNSLRSPTSADVIEPFVRASQLRTFSKVS